MGQAKLRGTYEQRKAEGELRVAREFIERENEIKRLDASLSLEEKEKRRAALKLIAIAAAYGLGL
jgi:hypothetical protein